MAREKRDKNKNDQAKGSKGPASRLFALILCCFFISGLTGLTYEILWTRMIVKIIGSAPFAVSIVLTVFMGGLGLGSYLAGRSIDRIKNPLKLIMLYGILELIIGAYGLILPLLLTLIKPVYAILYNQLFGYFLGYNLITFAGCFILLIIPVTCMGATLPVLSRFFITTISRVGTQVGRIYGLNTIGAAAGSILCGFWLINFIGVWGSLIFAIVLNGIIGIVCIMVSYALPRRSAVPEILTEAATRSREYNAAEADIPEDAGKYRIYALTIFTVTGFCAMAYEVVWSRLLGLIVGPTTYSFTIVLVTFITGLAFGSIFFGWQGDRVKNVTFLLLFTQIVAALFALLSSQIMGNSQIFFAKLIYHFKDHFAVLSLLKAAVLFMFMFFPTFFLGAAFPLVGKIYTQSLSRTGRAIGFAYAVNSVGAVLGAFCAGFLFIPLIGKEWSLSLIIAIQLLTSLIIGCRLFWKKRDRVSNWIPLAAAAILGLVLIFPNPYWDRKMLSVGKYHRFDINAIKDLGWLETLFSGSELFADYPGGEIVYFGDGIGGFTTVMKQKTDIFRNIYYCLYNRGKADASSRFDMDTQTLLAHLPMLFHPDPKSVLVVGLASGITAGEILYYPVDKLDVVEINQQVVDASNFFLPWNNNLLSNPKTELIIQDGRAHMELSDRKYDVISSEPSNPWMAGQAILFTEEFFRLARDRLNDDGIYVQWIHAYQMDWPTFALVGRTFFRVFPNSLLIRTNPLSLGSDFLLVGLKSEERLNESVAERNLRYAQQSKNITLHNHRVFYHLIVSEDLKKLFGEGPVNTDIRPWLEFSAPKLIHTHDPVIRRKIRSNRWLSRETVRILKEDSTDVDLQIDFVDYAITVIKPDMPFKNPVDLLRATDSQRERFSRLMEDYCTNNIVKDFSFLDGENLKKKCISIQIQKVQENIDSTQNKAPMYYHLGNLYYENGMLEEAIRYYSESLRLDPEKVHVNENMKKALLMQGWIEKDII
ncbi:fused MFS/spermidine synthase [Thermodesulfobacteriota bacterium]